MKICHLHIGMHKTGSSSIQEYLQRNKDNLGDRVRYAQMGTANHSGPLTYALRFDPHTDPEVLTNRLSYERNSQIIAKYKSILNNELQSDFNQLIFSAEGLVKLNREELLSFKSELLKYVDKIYVYCYVREPKSYISSAFQQIIKTKPIGFNSDQVFPFYKKRLSKFEEVFEVVKYRPFSREHLIDNNVVTDFCEWLGLPSLPAKSVNSSLSSLAVKFLYLFQHNRKRVVVSQLDLSFFERVLSNLSDVKPIFPASVIKDLFLDNYSDFEWVQSRLERKFDIGETCEQTGFGNFYGFFSENEKKKILQLANYDELNSHVLVETGKSIPQLLNIPIPELSGYNFKLNIVSNRKIVGWACDFSECENLLVSLYLENKKIKEVPANIKRQDLNGRAIGYRVELQQPIKVGQIIEVRLNDVVVYSGTM